MHAYQAACAPAAHAQPSLEFVRFTLFAGHTVHGAEPTSCLYCPRAHATHAPPSAVNPTSHAQTTLALADTALAMHGTHVAAKRAAVAVENVFTGHRVHSSLLTSVLKNPGSHPTQYPGQTSVTISLPSTWISRSPSMLAAVFRTCRYRPVVAAEHFTFFQSSAVP